MDKITPKSAVFKANLDRAAPLLKALRAEGIGHMIDGRVVPSISGDTFVETKHVSLARGTHKIQKLGSPSS